MGHSNHANSYEGGPWSDKRETLFALAEENTRGSRGLWIGPCPPENTAVSEKYDLISKKSGILYKSIQDLKKSDLPLLKDLSCIFIDEYQKYYGRKVQLIVSIIQQNPGIKIFLAGKADLPFTFINKKEIRLHQALQEIGIRIHEINANTADNIPASIRRLANRICDNCYHIDPSEDANNDLSRHLNIQCFDDSIEPSAAITDTIKKHIPDGSSLTIIALHNSDYKLLKKLRGLVNVLIVKAHEYFERSDYVIVLHRTGYDRTYPNMTSLLIKSITAGNTKSFFLSYHSEETVRKLFNYPRIHIDSIQQRKNILFHNGPLVHLQIPPGQTHYIDSITIQISKFDLPFIQTLMRNIRDTNPFITTERRKLGIFPEVAIKSFGLYYTFEFTDLNICKLYGFSSEKITEEIYRAFLDFFGYNLQKDYRSKLKVTRLDIAVEYFGMSKENIEQQVPILKLSSYIPKQKKKSQKKSRKKYDPVKVVGEDSSPTVYGNYSKQTNRSYLSNHKKVNTVHSESGDILKFEIQDNSPGMNLQELCDNIQDQNYLKNNLRKNIHKRLSFIKDKAPRENTIIKWTRKLNIQSMKDVLKYIDSLYDFRRKTTSDNIPPEYNTSDFRRKLFWIYIYFLKKEDRLKILTILGYEHQIPSYSEPVTHHHEEIDSPSPQAENCEVDKTEHPQDTEEEGRDIRESPSSAGVRCRWRKKKSSDLYLYYSQLLESRACNHIKHSVSPRGP